MSDMSNTYFDLDQSPKFDRFNSGGKNPFNLDNKATMSNLSQAYYTRDHTNLGLSKESSDYNQLKTMTVNSPTSVQYLPQIPPADRTPNGSDIRNYNPMPSTRNK